MPNGGHVLAPRRVCEACGQHDLFFGYNVIEAESDRAREICLFCNRVRSCVHGLACLAILLEWGVLAVAPRRRVPFHSVEGGVRPPRRPTLFRCQAREV